MADAAKDKFTTGLRAKTTTLWDLANDLFTDADEFAARGWSGNVTDADISDQNYDITAADLSNVLGTVDAIKTLFSQGHSTNLAKVIKR